MQFEVKNKTKTRENIAKLKKDNKTKVLIIGGGINGIGTFRDLALQGVSVTLIEKNDYCSGSSAASSHMIHGGIRYLENGEFRLVKEAVQERNRLLRIAPHFVKPLKTTIPIFNTFSGVISAPVRFITHKNTNAKERGAALIKTGLLLYDFFASKGKQLPNHEFHNKQRSLFELPELNPNIKYTATYYDASIVNPERLALDVLTDAMKAGKHARCANYLSAVGFSETEGVRVRDEITKEEFYITADVVINATGPWVDKTNQALNKTTALTGGTKGSHIVLDNPQLLAATDGREIFFENKDGRIVLIYPINGKVMVGTTDIDVSMDDPIVCTAEEIKYFFELVNFVFPNIELTEEQIVYNFSGVRPLPKHDDINPGFISRDYSIITEPISDNSKVKLVSLVGGKWTTFRALSEHLCENTLALIGMSRIVTTDELAIGGGKDYPVSKSSYRLWIKKYVDHYRHENLFAARVEQLLQRYGTKAVEFMDYIEDKKDWFLDLNEQVSALEIEFLILSEHVVNLEDIIQRRTNFAFMGQLTINLLEDIAKIAAKILGWDENQRLEQKNSTISLLEKYHGVILK